MPNIQHNEHVKMLLLLLRAMERVRLRSTVYCLLDLFLAVVIPVGILTLVVTAFVFTVSQEYDSILDRPGDPEFEYRLAWMAAAVFPYLTVLPVIFSKIFYSNIYGPVEIFFMAWGLFKWALLQLQFFSTDLLTILKGQIGTISLESAQRNWTIGMSVGFSLAYIIAVAFLLLAKRSLIFRTASTRILQHFIEHPRGPIGGFALMLAGVLFVARFYV